MENTKEQLTLTVEQGTKADFVSDNVYAAQVSDIQKVTMEFGDALRISFKIQEGAEAGKTVTGLAKYALNEKTKLYNWLKVIGLNLPVGQAVDLHSILGKRCRVLTKTRTKGSTSGEIMKYSNVAEVLPA